MTILCNLRVCLAISRWFDATSLPGSDSIALFRTHSRVFGSPFRLLAAGQTGIDSFTARIARSVWGLAFGKLSLILSQGFEFHRLVFRAQLFTSSMRCCLHSNKKRSKRNSSTPRCSITISRRGSANQVGFHRASHPASWDGWRWRPCLSCRGAKARRQDPEPLSLHSRGWRDEGVSLDFFQPRRENPLPGCWP